MYNCDCHGQPADKTPCERKREDRAEGKFSESTLGTWRCSVTRRKCKVSRTKKKTEEVTNEAEV